MESLSEATQEYLESIYWLYESGIERTQANLARALQVSQPSVSEMLRRMVDDDLVSRDEAKQINFTVRGREVAERIVARHRLVEAYLVKVMGIPWDDVHEEAHAMEHSISPRLEAKMLEMIGDIHTCPHGHPIGDAPREAGEILVSLPAGSRARVLRLENEDPDLLRVLKAAGVEPGDTITLMAVEGDDVQLDTGLGERSLTLDAAATVSVAVVERGTGPTGIAPEKSAAALLSGSSWGR
jgi:DtxR family Mn-dependent transcriptional regulator